MTETVIDEVRAHTHPQWCDTDRECKIANGCSEHHGLATTWSAMTDDVQITLHLVRLDESCPRTGIQLQSNIRSRLTIRNTAMNNVDGSPIWADVDLDITDLDLLLTFMQQRRRQMSGIQFEIPTENKAQS